MNLDLFSFLGHTNIVLATFDTPSVSPYKVNTSYQRPTPQIGDSDHGYSTMTPQETDNNSENASTTTSVRGGLIIGRDRYRPNDPHKLNPVDGITTVLPMLPPPPGSSNRRSPTPPIGQVSGRATTVACVYRPPSIPEQTVLDSETIIPDGNLLTTTVQVHAN